MTHETQPPDFNAIRESTVLQDIRLLVVQALYGREDLTLSWPQILAYAQNLRERADRAEALLVQTREALLSARWLLGCRPDCCCKLNRALKAIDAREAA